MNKLPQSRACCSINLYYSCSASRKLLHLFMAGLLQEKANYIYLAWVILHLTIQIQWKLCRTIISLSCTSSCSTSLTLTYIRAYLTKGQRSYYLGSSMSKKNLGNNHLPQLCLRPPSISLENRNP